MRISENRIDLRGKRRWHPARGSRRLATLTVEDVVSATDMKANHECAVARILLVLLPEIGQSVIHSLTYDPILV